ncbi:putative acyl-activating enzyme 19 [Silene latifolia]|uniref:putative acyl-activating enzyme 19 n=1 Tax=Silene latifolia TaxID=37657 RepID=UPI003D786DB8
MTKQPSCPSRCCISHEFQHAASINPTKIAIINCTPKLEKTLDDDDDKSNITNSKENFLTFSQILPAVDFFTFKLCNIFNGGYDPSLIKPTSGNHFTNKSGVFATKLIGVYMLPSVEYVISVLSILRCAAAFLPLDPFWPKNRILNVISSSNVDLILGCFNSDQNNSAHLINKSSRWLLDCCNCPVLCISNIDEIFDQKCGNLDLVWPCENSDSMKFSYLMYTSGSMGKPKGVCGREEGLLNRFLWMQELYPLNKNDDVLLFKTSISFIDHLQEFLAPMMAGCTLVIPQFDELKKNMFGLVDVISEYSITRLTAVPSLIRAILPSLEEQCSKGIESSLKMLVLSGEVFPISLWSILSRILRRTSILNIYGSTEVAGDCTYFDCKRLPSLLELETLSSVPIGKPIFNCDVGIVYDNEKQEEGELCVAGVCVSSGYYSEGDIMPLDYIQLKQDTDSSDGRLSRELYYRTGDFARRLQGGDLYFIGRKDRTIKVSGQRIALEEVEDTLRGHPKIADVAVVFLDKQEEHAFLGAALVLKDSSQSSEVLRSIKSWMIERFTSAMIPREIVCVEAIPMSSSGKVDYTLLPSSFSRVYNPQECHTECSKTLEYIKESFCKALGVAEVGDDDDFFAFGGDSILAAHVAHKLGVDMRLLYMFPSPSRLQKAVTQKGGTIEAGYQIMWEKLPNAQKEDLLQPSECSTLDFGRSRKYSQTVLAHSDEHGSSKHLKVDTGRYSKTKAVKSISFSPWGSFSELAECSYSRCNKVMHKTSIESDNLSETLKVKLLRDIEGSLREIWRVPMDSCVDASPLVVFNKKEILVFIGSHSHKFVCVDARNGLVRWEMKLEGRIESSAVVDGDFSQVIFGCYQGKLYFIDLLKGTINWTFQTGGEVKSQATVDKCRHLIWCGSHDHNLYGLDYRNHCCVYEFPCGGSIFGSPAIDETREILYAGTTNGRLIAISLKGSLFSLLWLLEVKAPIFGSLSISSNGNVICCLVSGDVISVNLEGSIIWRSNTDGPIFAGPCISMAIGSQALVCSRNGNVYSFDSENGCLLWEYYVGDPITSSGYVDDHIKLVSDPFSPSQRFACICSSSGRILVLLISCITIEGDRPKEVVQKFAEIDLKGDIFSSPVMVAGKIFVGCRDDFLHCLVVEALVEGD